MGIETVGTGFTADAGLTVKEWDKHFAFDVYALWYQLLNENFDKKDTEATGQLEFLRTELMQTDIVRALELID